MVSIEQVSMTFGKEPLFENISFLINDKEKIVLIGRNGAGKTTLLKLLSGQLQPSSGRIVLPKEMTIGYLPQHMALNSGRTVLEEAELAFQEIKSIECKIDELNREIAVRTDYESEAYHQLLEDVSYQNERLNFFGGDNYQADLEKTLLGLGFLRSDFDRQTSEFSGGWRMRIELAKILLRRPDLLLLDEPTNHLDIESIVWLENFLSSTSSALVLVSHDKAFIDAVTTRTIEISLGKIYDYKVNYSNYLELRKERREQQIRAYENQQKMIADTEEFIERFRYKATKAVQVQSRIKQLEKLERLEVDMEDTSRLNLKFPPAPHSGIQPVKIESLSKWYGDKVVLENVNFSIRRGEKVAFVGRNGEGKSTLIKCIMGEVAYDGFLKLGHQVKIGYFAQNQADLLDGELTVFETVDHVAVGDVRTKIRDILGAFMFGGEASDKKVKVLSGGEKSRLAMIRLLLEPVNLLILDEPTNHLDIQSKNVLKEAIKAFNGTVIIVSHDRNFLDGLVEKIYEFKNRNLREFIGDIHQFLEMKRSEEEGFVVAKEPVVVTEVSENKQNYEMRKEFNRKLRKAEKLVADAENEITELETEITEMEAKMADGNSSQELFDSYKKTTHTLEQKMYEWQLLSESLEEIKAQNPL
ncbi:MAG: ABC-F family ATP-binding cassette domain-containing protein [Paludibacteraceae bacterium]|jgi:ATP-binding cassette subfamily F protein 3|nr:ABC-F family ATP-binding cassette domain-containing protein [Paludibacteraceae bacterium]MDI9537324.1 ABC-F family ATP-binding cassette domain-containing protein [Bacteroidota bacterium]MBP9039333.1 ABC-F family ATP-binding cassette domain-containing protein [Paludibacteraceae bacterium]HOA46555.1 ABC-F family ATP-binding cassette domain-containing protein [Paludibacteraceae bacterium]HOO23826.1 ABC-F family ATP-binding cassette domain-containing protein [Paludibacteraceae bacterium]